jgi:hypothetical protein
MVREFAQALGIALVLFGLVGLAIGEQYLAGLVNVHLGADLLHLITGVILAWVAFARRPAGLVRQAVVGMGLLYLVLALLGWFVPALFGLLPQAFTTADNLLHLAIGVLALVVVWLSGRRLMTQTLGG